MTLPHETAGSAYFMPERAHFDAPKDQGTSVPEAAPAAQPAAAPAPDYNSMSPNDRDAFIDEIFRSDPFAANPPGSGTSSAAPEDPPGGTAAPGTGPGAAAGGSPSDGGTPPAAPELSPDVKALVDVIRQEREASAAAAAEADPPPNPWERSFQFQISPEVQAALNSEDPAQRTEAVRVMMNDVATRTFARMGEVVQAQLAQAKEEGVQQAQAEARRAETRQQFFTRHPDLNKPMLHGVIQAAMQDIARQENVTSFTDEFGDRVAASVRDAIGLPAPTKEPPKEGNERGGQHDFFGASPRPPHINNGGGAPGVGTRSTPNAEQTMLGELFALGRQN